MELETGEDLLALKELVHREYSEEATATPPAIDAAAYARWNGLTVNSLVDPWPQIIAHDDLLSTSVEVVEDGETIELEGLEEPVFHMIIPVAEHVGITRSSVPLLQQARQRLEQHEVPSLREELCTPITIFEKLHKLEEPALQSDHNTDCRKLKRKIERIKNQQPWKLDNLPLFPEDPERGEGLTFPTKARQGGKDLMKALKQETLEVTRDSVAFLVHCIKDSLTEADQTDFLNSISTYNGIRAREYLTPPLSPEIEDPPEYFVPTESDCEIPAPSEGDSQLLEDIAAAEAKIFAEDTAFWNEVAAQPVVSPERYADLDIAALLKAGELTASSPSPLATPPKHISRDLKVDVPLILSDGGSADSEKPTRVLDPRDLAQARALADSSDTIGVVDEQLAEFLNIKAINAMRSVEQERLEPIDAIARMPVPIMDFSLPPLEWAHGLWKPETMYRSIRKKADVNWDIPKWPTNRNVEQRMVWAPMGHADQKVSVYEKLESDKLRGFLARPDKRGMLTSADCLVRSQKLFVFRPTDDDDSEVEIEDDSFGVITNKPSKATQNVNSPRNSLSQGEGQRRIPIKQGNRQLTKRHDPLPDLMTIINGRKRSIDEMIYEKLSASASAGHMAPLPDFASTDIIDPGILDCTNVLRSFAHEYTDFRPLVSNFIEINTPNKKPKLTHSSFFKPTNTPTPAPVQQFKALEAAKLMPPPPKPIPAIAPEVHLPTIPPRVIVSATISPLFLTELRRLIPGIDLIRREHNKHQPPNWVPGTPPNADEADLILSPATGILMTTLVKLRQKALPNQQPSQSNYRTLVSNVALRYERLIILVSEGNKHSETMSPLSPSDAKALAEFHGFAAGLDTEIHTCYVGGGNQTLAKWAAAAVCRHAPEGASVQNLLLQAETGWEMFMRLAGMNVYAAQVTLGILKVPDGERGVGGERFYGLPLFVMMTREERIARLEDSLGGRKVLTRVSEVIDRPWGRYAVGDLR